MAFITKLLWSKVSAFISELVRQFIQTKFFLFVLALTIGISYTTVYFVGKPLYADLFFKDENNLVWINPRILSVEPAEAKEIPEAKEVVWLKGEFTAYTPRTEETDSDPHTNAAGKRVKEGDVACPKKYAFGTKIEVQGVGTFQCWDRMNQRYQDKENFDLFMWDLAEAQKFGRQNLAYRVIEN